jgi:superfamily II DNA/RNA helicase
MGMGSLKSVKWKIHISGPDEQLLDNLYVPALERAVHYDRCCSYFSSSVLAAAASGFAGIIKNILDHSDKIPKPAIRLLINEQLDQQDLKALLSKGDYEPLIRKLLKQFKTPREFVEKHRLETLAWLVANGWLEVRVGLMRNANGMLHAKYGIVRDSWNNVLAFMGSGNETREGVISNYEEFRIFCSWEKRSKPDTDHFQNRFDELWENRDPYVTTVLLPDAVKQKLIKLAPSKPPTEDARDSKESLETAMLWKFIAHAPFLPNGESACDETAPIDMWPHQRKVVDDTARGFPAGRLLCDEVGMGKTIEAIFVLKRLLCGRGVKRALLLVPAGLLKQWQDELREKGGLLVPIWEDGFLRHPHKNRVRVEPERVFKENNVLLVSREWARLESNRAYILDAKWDLVLMDEAHAARRKSPKEGEFNNGNLLLETLRDLQLRRCTKGILLLSATPMQTQPWEPWDLLAVLGVGGNWLAEFRDIRTYYKVVASLKNKKTPHIKDINIACKLVENDPEFPSCKKPSPIDKGKLSEELSFAIDEKREEYYEEYAEYLKRGAPLGRRMHRNTRDTLSDYYQKGIIKYSPPKRDVEDVVFQYEDRGERECYNAIKTYIDTRFEQLEGEKSGKGFVMTIYRRRAVSSPFSLRQSLERRLEACDKIIKDQCFEKRLYEDERLDIMRDLEDAGIEIIDVDPALPETPQIAEEEKLKIKSLIDKLNALGNKDSKFARFREVLADITDDGRSVLVFTEYYDTLQYLRDLLQPIYGDTLGCFSGKGGEYWNGNEWLPVGKAEITKLLQDRKLKVLICTDAASEGLNLQAASALINYDLPWNPSKVEQRIGRIDRIGQMQEKLPIRNMFLKDSVDMRVYQVLRERCGLFHHFVGHMQPILALARDALRLERADEFLGNVDKKIEDIESDSVTTNIFEREPAEEPNLPEAVLKREDIEYALDMLERSPGKIKAKKKMNKPNSWKIIWGRQSEEVSTESEMLERDKNIKPIVPGDRIVDLISENLALPANRTPLVIEEFVDPDERFRAVEIRWICGERIEEISNISQLQKLISEWDGTNPAPAILYKAREEARKKAKKRVENMKTEWEEKEKLGIDAQISAARLRLLREVGRTMRCLGDSKDSKDSKDISLVFKKQLEKERSDKRYRKVIELLGNYPSWSSEELDEIEDFVKRENQKKARITGTEIDAALNDPRWRAHTR